MILRITAITAAVILLLALVGCPKQASPENSPESQAPAAETTPTPEATPPVDEIPPAEIPVVTEPDKPSLGPGTNLPPGWPEDLRLAQGFEIVSVDEPAEDGSMVLKARMIEGTPWISPWDLSDYYTTAFRGWGVTQEDSPKWVRSDFDATIPLTKDNEKVLIEIGYGQNNIQEMTFTYSKIR
jgi:hypothetical protein